MENIKTKDYQKENKIITLVLWLLVCGVSIAAMLYVASHKTIVIADVQSGGQSLNAEEVVDATDAIKVSYPLMLKKDALTDGSFSIPLEAEIKAEKVVVENRYWDKEIWIYIQGAEEGFFAENIIHGDTGHIIKGDCEVQRNRLILKMQMDSIFEYRTIMDGNEMVLTFEEPKAVYEHVIVIDPAYGGDETGTIMRGYAEKILTMQIADMLPGKVDSEGVKLYFTRREDETVSREERVVLAEELDADLYIRISAKGDEDAGKYGISACYNENYFIPEFGNVQLADVLTRCVTVASSNLAEGVITAEEESILQDLSMPAAQINVGYLTHPVEGELLGTAEYREKLAQGIADAIMEVCADEK